MRLKLTKDIVFLDLETTGTDVNKDKIVEIACIKIKIDGTRQKFYSMLDPQTQIPVEASNVHGITNETIAGSPTFSDIHKPLLSFIEDCDFGGFNSNQFDLPLLFNEFKRCDIILNTDVNLIDVYAFYKKIHNNKLSSIYKRLTGKELKNAHGAMADIEATLDIFSILWFQTENEMSVSEIDLFSQGDKLRFDLAGKMYINNNGNVCWSFGKNVNLPVLNDLKYCQWVLGEDFPDETKAKLRVLLKK